MRKAKIGFRLLLITDSSLTEKNLIKVIDSACKNGVKAVQLRNKILSSKDILTLAKRLRTVTKKYKASLVINDRLDIALLTGADCVHSPESGIEAGYIKMADPKLIAGKSVHSIQSARKAEKNGYDYVLFGPVFSTPSKVKYGEPQGIEKLNKVCSSLKIPVFAVGGISPARAKECLDAGAYGVTVIRAIMSSKNIKNTVNEFHNSIGSL